MIFVKNFTLPDFYAKNFTSQKCVICNTVHTQYTGLDIMLNAFEISSLDIFVRLELNYAVFEKPKNWS